jgi:hypothetical protein
MLYRRDVLKSLAALVCALFGFAGKQGPTKAQKTELPDSKTNSWTNRSNWAGGAMPRPTTTIRLS